MKGENMLWYFEFFVRLLGSLFRCEKTKKSHLTTIIPPKLRDQPIIMQGIIEL